MFARNLKKQIEKRFKDCGTTNEVFCMGNFFDPDMRGLILKEFPGVYERTINQVKALCLKYYNEQQVPVPQEEQATNDGDQVEPERSLTGAEKLKRRRKITWFNPPFSANVKSNIGKDFLKLIDSAFPATNPLHKLFSRQTVKVSYKCMPNIASSVARHNMKVFVEKTSSNVKNDKMTKTSKFLRFLMKFCISCC